MNIHRVLSMLLPVCSPPKNAVTPWYQNTYGVEPHNCTIPYGGVPSYVMLNAYRSGGRENVHWVYTNQTKDPRCLKDWIYYKSNGNDKYATIAGRITKARSAKYWCALPVYRATGVVGKQIDYCSCKNQWS